MENPFTDEEIKEMEDSTPWPRCANCKHLAESHPFPSPQSDDNHCEGDYEGQTCNCTEYKMPEGWTVVDGQPIRSSI